MANDHVLTLRFGGRKTLSRRTTDFDLRHFENSQKMKPNFDSAKDLPRIDFFPCRRRIRGRFDKPEKFLP